MVNLCNICEFYIEDYDDDYEKILNSVENCCFETIFLGVKKYKWKKKKGTYDDISQV